MTQYYGGLCVFGVHKTRPRSAWPGLSGPNPDPTLAPATATASAGRPGSVISESDAGPAIIGHPVDHTADWPCYATMAWDCLTKA